MKLDAHAFQERGHRPPRGLRAGELRSQVGNLRPRCLEIGIGSGSRLGDCQDLGLQPLNELSVGFGPGMMLRDLLGVPGPLGLELGLEFGRVCLPQGGQPFQLIELRGKFVVALTELLGKLVALGIPIAELSLEVPKLLPELVAL